MAFFTRHINLRVDDLVRRAAVPARRQLMRVAGAARPARRGQRQLRVGHVIHRIANAMIEGGKVGASCGGQVGRGLVTPRVPARAVAADTATPADV